jgi:hypothetical protein
MDNTSHFVYPYNCLLFGVSMKFFKVLFLLVFFSPCLLAKLYGADEVVRFDESFIESDVVSFKQGFFTSSDPQKYIASFIQSTDKTEQFLYREAMLYRLLGEVSFHTKQIYLTEFVQQMINYQLQAMKYHDEGRVEVPVYDIRSKALGIQNIWRANDSLSYYQTAFELHPIDVLTQLAHNNSKLSMPEFLGLKNAIDTMSIDSKSVVSGFLQENPQSSKLLNKFSVYFALKTRDKLLIVNRMNSLDSTNQQLLLRKLPQVFDDEFVIEQYVSSVESGHNSRFALSLLSPFVDKGKGVKDYVLSVLEDKNLSSSAVFVLSQSKDVKFISGLKVKYQNSDSTLLKSNIRMLLRLNQLPESHIILNDLNSGEVQ